MNLSTLHFVNEQISRPTVESPVEFVSKEVGLKDGAPLPTDSVQSAYHELSLFFPFTLGQLQTHHFHKHGFNENTLD